MLARLGRNTNNYAKNNENAAVSMSNLYITDDLTALWIYKKKEGRLTYICVDAHLRCKTIQINQNKESKSEQKFWTKTENTL